MSASTSASPGSSGGGVVDVAAGHDEHVHGGLGIEVTEGHGVLGPVHDVGGDVTGDDAAEEAVRRCRSPAVPVSYWLSARSARRPVEPFTSG